MANHPSDEHLAEMVRLLTQGRIENWLDHGLGSWRWWVLAVLLVAPWFLWVKLADKKKIHELALFGLIIMVFTITLDELGFVLSLWSYPVEIIPMFPRLTSIDYTVVPIVYTLIYQYFSTWKSFFWALVALAALFSFVAEPIIVSLGFYVLIKWAYWTSFLIYIPMGLVSKWITQMFIDVTRKANAKED